MLQVLAGKIERAEANLAVIGLGYVGLPVACVFARAGFRVTGLEIKPARVDMINAGRCPIDGEEPGLPELLAEVVAARRLRASGDDQDLAEADVILIGVETPVDDRHRPQYTALSAACRSLGPVLKEGALVVVESVARLVPGVLGNERSADEESFSAGLLEYPQFTRPASFRGWEVPDVLRSGDHGRVEEWRRVQSLVRTLRLRPDLVEARGGLSDQEVRLLVEHDEVQLLRDHGYH